MMVYTRDSGFTLIKRMAYKVKKLKSPYMPFFSHPLLIPKFEDFTSGLVY